MMLNANNEFNLLPSLSKAGPKEIFESAENTRFTIHVKHVKTINCIRIFNISHMLIQKI